MLIEVRVCVRHKSLLNTEHFENTVNIPFWMSHTVKPYFDLSNQRYVGKVDEVRWNIGRQILEVDLEFEEDYGDFNLLVEEIKNLGYKQVD